MAITSVLCFLFGYWECIYIAASFRMHTVSPVLRMPAWIPETGIAYGLVAMGAYFLYHTMKTANELRKLG